MKSLLFKFKIRKPYKEITKIRKPYKKMFKLYKFEEKKNSDNLNCGLQVDL